MLEHLITNYGYPALALGAFFEGEVALIIAGFMAFIGYMHLPYVILVSFLCTLFADQFYFFIGRTKGKAFIEKRPKLKKQAELINRMFEKYSNLVLFFFRFAYGFRIIIPISLGTSKISAKRFTFFNVIGALLWSIGFSLGGYFFGTALEAVFADIKRYELKAVGFIIVVGLILGLVVLARKRTFLEKLGVDPKFESNMII
jgi:membrane protein DedA with SNARE-associated domain